MDSMRLVISDPEIVSGTPVFVGSRVPVRTLFDYLEDDAALRGFLDNFPSVAREQAVAVLELCRELIELEAQTKHGESIIR